ncbi:MAG TPA: thioesterase domain-containing protein [Acidobacteriaceae bacterium]|nr:thioesterase domain-containing protein [Acidobacteriaceae bacterium]
MTSEDKQWQYWRSRSRESLGHLVREKLEHPSTLTSFAADGRFPADRVFLYFHSAAGSAAAGAFLAARYTGWSFVGVRMPGLFGETDIPGSIAEEASIHVRSILEQFPGDRRFIVSGFSTGGILAYEAAVQLAKSGHVPEKCILIDAPHPGELLELYGTSTVDDLFRSRLIRLLKRSRAPAGVITEVQDMEVSGAVEQLVTEGVVLGLLGSGAVADAATRHQVALQSLVYVKAMHASAHYQVPGDAGVSTCFVQAVLPPESAARWARSLPGLEITPITCHETDEMSVAMMHNDYSLFQHQEFLSVLTGLLT